MVERDRSSAEVLENEREVNLYLVRHGEQTKYREDNSPLSIAGRVQVMERFAIPFCQNLSKEGPSIVKIYSSARPRAMESAQLIEDEVKRGINDGKLKDVCLYETRIRKELQITDPISKMLANGSEPQMAFIDWQLTPEPVLNLAFNTKSPRQVAQDLDIAIDQLTDLAERVGSKGPNINMIFVTHETALGALAKKHIYQMRPWLRIAHAENLRVSIHNNGNITYHFRDREAKRR